MKIPQHCPYFQIRLMCVIYIIRICKRCNITFCIRKTEPCRCNRIQPFCRRNRFQYITISIGVRNIMPRHIDRIVFRNIRIFRFFIIPGYQLFFNTVERICFHISDKPVFCSHFHPVILIFKNSYLIRFLYFCQNRTFHTALIAYLRIPFDGSHFLLSPLSCNHYAGRIIIHFVFHIRVLLDKRKGNICNLSFCFQDHIIFTLFLCYVCIFFTAYRCRNTASRKCIKKNVLIRIPIKPLIDPIMSNRIFDIILPVINFHRIRRISFFCILNPFHNLIVNYKRRICF